jgi:hypothetical protein
MCFVPECDLPIFAIGYCSRHYTAFRKYGNPNVVKQKQHHGMTPTERFWRYVVKTDGCWRWTSYTDPNGYGRLNVNGKPILASRMSYLVHFGSIPDGMYVCHKCDNPVCSNPDHLFLGSQADNVRDMHSKGRAHKRGLPGEAHHSSKLTNELVMEIRRTTDSDATLSKRLKISRATIHSARHGKTWRHLPMK